MAATGSAKGPRKAGLLGLAHGTVALSDHRPEWARLYRVEAKRLRGGLGDLALDIRHIGSTAIGEIKAKPILDIMVGIDRLERAADCADAMLSLGYEDMGQAIVPEDHIFGKGAPRTHLVHFVTFGDRHWIENITFLECLMTFADLRSDYEALKLDLAAQFPRERSAYTAAKAQFIQSVIAEAQSRLKNR